MTNLRSDALITRRIVCAFIDFLNSVEPAPGVDNEALEVAKDCLSQFFQLNQLSRSDNPETNLLVNLFTSHNSSWQNENNPGNHGKSPSESAEDSTDLDHAAALKFQDGDGAAAASQIGVSRDELFGQFFAALEKNHFFRTMQGGDDEHVLLDRVTSLFHDAINLSSINSEITEILRSGCEICDRKSLAEALKTLGNKVMQSNAYVEAIERYTCAIALCENNAVYYCNRAAAYTQVGKYDDAIRDSLSAINIDPTYSKAYSRLGFAYYLQGNYGDAINEGYKKALDLDPNNNAVKENLKAAEHKLREQQERRGRNQGHTNPFPEGSRNQGGHSPFASVSFDAGGVPASLASMFMNVPPSYPRSGYNSANVPASRQGATSSSSFSSSMGIDPANIASMFTSSTPDLHQQQNPRTPSSAEPNHGAESNPSPFPSMPFDPSAMPANLADLLMNLSGVGENSQGQPRGESHTEMPQVSANGHTNFNLGGNRTPEELLGTLRAMMGMFSPAASQGDQPGNGDGSSASS
ncbi:hypothetical protein V2J09_004316 [Rumex salicifolius]